MSSRPALIYTFLVMALFLLLLSGCTTMPSSSSAPSQADLLMQSGFNSLKADTPEKLAYLKSLPPKKVVQQNYQGKTAYVVCPDPSIPQCYVGDEAAYQRYQQLSFREAEEQRAVAEQRWDPQWWVLYAGSQGAGQ